MNNFLHKFSDIYNIEKINPKIKKIMKNGIKVSFILLLFSNLFLALYTEFGHPTYLFDIGSMMFKSSSNFIVYFIIYGICFNKILNDAGIN